MSAGEVTVTVEQRLGDVSVEVGGEAAVSASVSSEATVVVEQMGLRGPGPIDTTTDLLAQYILARS